MDCKITIKKCDVDKEGQTAHRKTSDAFIWRNDDDATRTIHFDPDTPNLFGSAKPPKDIPIAAHSHSDEYTVADDARNDGDWHYSILECPIRVGPHVIIVRQ